jgi:hypothetical protein
VLNGGSYTPKERPRGENVVDLMEALRRSVSGANTESSTPKKAVKKSAEGRRRPEGDANANSRQEAGEGARREEAFGRAATEVSLEVPTWHFVS